MITEFSVNRWADLEKTRPRHLSPWCRTCHRAVKRERIERRPSHPRRRKGERDPDPLVLSKLDMLNMMLEGGVPLRVNSIADEDYDPTPVPQGCPRCYLRGSEVCFRCPDKERARRERRHALALSR